MFLLVPGRHHLLTDFQFKYLNRLIKCRLEGEKDVYGTPLDASEIDGVIFAVTSANHLGTKRNPVPFYLRAMIIQEFSNSLDVPVFVYGIDDVGMIGGFSEYTVKTIRHSSEGAHALTPANTIVICSTAVKEMYLQQGFKVLPAEWDPVSRQFTQPMPWDVVNIIDKTKCPKKTNQMSNFFYRRSKQIKH